MLRFSKIKIDIFVDKMERFDEVFSKVGQMSVEFIIVIIIIIMFSGAMFISGFVLRGIILIHIFHIFNIIDLGLGQTRIIVIIIIIVFFIIRIMFSGETAIIFRTGIDFKDLSIDGVRI